MKNRCSGTDGGDIVRLGGEWWVGGVVLLEDTVGEWKACARASALVKRSTGIALIMFSSSSISNNTLSTGIQMSILTGVPTPDKAFS